jgi:hypothetical protein
VLRGLEFVQQVDVYRKEFKIPGEMVWVIEKGGTTCHVDVVVHPGVTEVEKLAEDIKAKTGVVESDEMKLKVLRRKVRVEGLPVEMVEKVAEIDEVRVIEEAVAPVLCGLERRLNFGVRRFD